MNTRKCKECGSTLDGKRPQAKFCCKEHQDLYNHRVRRHDLRENINAIKTMKYLFDEHEINRIQDEFYEWIKEGRNLIEVKNYFLEHNFSKWAKSGEQFWNNRSWIYFIRFSDINAIYIGETKNLFSRLNDYLIKGNISGRLKVDMDYKGMDRFILKIKQVEDKDRKIEEAKWIDKFKFERWYLYNNKKPNPLNVKEVDTYRGLKKKYTKKSADIKFLGFDEIFD